MNGTDIDTLLRKKLRSTTSPWERLPILIELAGKAKDGHQLATEALTIATELNDQFWIASSFHAIGRQLAGLTCYSEALHYLEKASRIFTELNHPFIKAEVNWRIAVVYVYQGKLREAMALLIEHLPWFESMTNQNWRVRAYEYIAYIYRLTGDHSKGLEYYQRAMKIAAAADMEKELSDIYLHLSFAYRDLGNEKRRAEYLFKCLASHRKSGHRGGMATVMLNIGSMYLERNQFARAERYVLGAGKLNRKLGYIAGEVLAWTQLGGIYNHKKDFANASRCYRRGIALACRSENMVYLGKLYEYFGLACLDADKPKKALSYMKKALTILAESGYLDHQYDIHEKLVRVYEVLGDMAKALEHHKEYIRMKEEYINAEKAYEVGRVEMREEMRELAESLKREQRTNTSLKKTIEEKEAELVALTLQLVQNESHQGERRSAINYSAQGGDHRLSNNWETFARQFHKIHNGFYANIITRYPELTPTEVKVCSLIRIGLSSKEMASILGVSKRTIDSHREHIHKKLNLSSRLVPFIKSL